MMIKLRWQARSCRLYGGNVTHHAAVVALRIWCDITPNCGMVANCCAVQLPFMVFYRYPFRGILGELTFSFLLEKTTLLQCGVDWLEGFLKSPAMKQ